MPPELWALGGVVVGALLGTIGQIVNASLQRRWAKEDRAFALTREQDQRLFDHKRMAYTEFLDLYLDSYHQLYAFQFQGESMDPEVLYDPLWKASVPVSLYGSLTAQRLAGDIIEGVAEFGDANTRELASAANKKVGQAYGDFLDEARRDLRSMEHLAPTSKSASLT
jgi:hypothetical protein